MILLKNIGLDYIENGETVHALQRISLRLPGKGLVLLAGSAGTGKTALAEIIGGKRLPSRGELVLLGQNTRRWTDKQYSAWRTLVRYCDQSALLEERSAFENARLSALLGGSLKKEAAKDAEDSLKQFGLLERSELSPRELSSGERKRLALACALAGRPSVLICDEPDTDADTLALLRACAEDRLVLVLTANERPWSETADRILHLEGGELLENGAEQRLSPAPAGAALSFRGLPAAFGLALKQLRLASSAAGSRALCIGLSTLLAAFGLGILSGTGAELDRTEKAVLSAYPVTITEESLPSGDITTAALAAEAAGAKSGFSVVQYFYAVQPQIYSSGTASGARMVYPAQNDAGNPLWAELPASEDLRLASYSLVSGRWPQRFDEAVLILDERGMVGVDCRKALGLTGTDTSNWKWSDYLRMTFRLVPPTELYFRNVDGTWGSMANDEQSLAAKVSASTVIKLVGVIRSDGSEAAMTGAVGYLPEMTAFLRQEIRTAPIVKQQQADKTTDVLNGLVFDTKGVHSADEATKRATLSQFVATLSETELKTVCRAAGSQEVNPTPVTAAALINTLSGSVLDGLYENFIGSRYSAGSYEANMKAFGVTDAERLISARFYSDSCAGRQRAIHWLSGWEEHLTYTDSAGTALESFADLAETFDKLNLLLTVLAPLLAAAAAAGVTAVAVKRRKGESSRLRALGADAGGLRRLYGWEAFQLSLPAALAGTVAGAGLAWLLGPILFGTERALPLLPAGILLAACVLCSVVSANLAVPGKEGK